MAKVLCTVCGKVLESKSRHDFQQCSCKNESFVDGGGDYTRVGGKDLNSVFIWNEKTEKFEFPFIIPEDKALKIKEESVKSTKTINDIVSEIHEVAKAKGWWDSIRSPLEIHALIHSEISEATEEVREHKEDYYLDAKGKPCGETTELIDAFIRIADYFGYMGWDFEKVLQNKMEYNTSRPHRHGNKKF